MKNKYLVIVLGVLVVGSIVTANATSIHNSNNNVQHLSFDFINQKSNLKDVVSSSELIIKGKVTKITPLEIKKVIFTDYEIDVDDVLKGEKQHVVVRLTGGTLDGTQLISDEIKPLEKNQKYIFCLEKVFPEDPNSNAFSPIGAYQGIFAIEESDTVKSTTSASASLQSLNNDKVKIKKFNTSNIVEKTILGKDIDITEYFQ